jgi:hypothetical protein
MKDNVLDFALETLLKELGCTVSDNGETATIQYTSRRLKLEKRDDHWYDLEKNLKFYSRAQIAIYIARNPLH